VTAGGSRFAAAFEHLRRASGDSMAVLDVGAERAATRDQLARLAESAAEALARSGAPPSPARTATAVAIRIPNSAELIAAVFGCWAAGRVPLPLDAELADAEAGGICRRLGVARVLSDAGGARCAELPVDGAALALPPDTALLKLTSGTTGEPRAVALTGDALSAGVAQIASTMGIEAGDRNLVPIPLAHSYGFDNVVLTLGTLGCPAVLVRDMTPQSLVAAGRAARATVLPAVPFLLDVLSRSRAAAGALWPELRLVISAGAPLPAETRERFASAFGVRPRTFYGATECGGIAFDREGAGDAPDGCVGSALDGVAIELDEADDGVGRVRVRSRSTATAYVSGAPPADATATGDDGDAARDADTAIGPGWFLTADLARIDERGRLHLVGRAGDVVNVGGRKVFPAEVERVIRAIPGVRDVAVVGVARSAVADALRAVVVADGEVDRERVVRACEAALARYKVPRSVEFRADLPRNARGKLDRRAL